MPAARAARHAVVAISRPGCELALRLRCALPGTDLFLPERFIPADRVDIHGWSGAPRELIRRLFGDYGALVVFGAVGMVVRIIAPLIREKQTDPAVVVVDDAGRYAVSVLSGHLGGANALATRVATILGALPVVTTASDVLDTIAPDLLGQEFGWRIEHAENLTQVSAALVNGEAVGLLQETGETGWWPAAKALPPNVIRFWRLDDLVASRCRAALIIADRTLVEWQGLLPKTVVYRPRSLVVGVGCNRGARAGEIVAALERAFERGRLALASIRNLATLDVKRDEPGLGEVAARLGVAIEYFSAQELDLISTVPSPSAVVRARVGTHGVCEPAALLSSSAETLLVPKLKTPNVTVAVARVDFSQSRRG